MEPKDRGQPVPSQSSQELTAEERANRERLASMIDPARQFLTLRYLLPEEPEEQRNEPNVEEAA